MTRGRKVFGDPPPELIERSLLADDRRQTYFFAIMRQQKQALTPEQIPRLIALIPYWCQDAKAYDAIIRLHQKPPFIDLKVLLSARQITTENSILSLEKQPYGSRDLAQQRGNQERFMR